MHKLYNYIIREALWVRGDVLYEYHDTIDDSERIHPILRVYGLYSDSIGFRNVLYEELGVRYVVESWEGGVIEEVHNLEECVGRRD